jgi:5-methylcytosine-specific restriction endonuclease McrA
MPKASRCCPSPGCTNLIKHTTYCPDHTTSWQVTNRWQRPPGWDKLRESILERDNWVCYICGNPGADTVDHVTSLARGGTNAHSNLAAVHDRTPPHCHRAKTNRERAGKL